MSEGHQIGTARGPSATTAADGAIPAPAAADGRGATPATAAADGRGVTPATAAADGAGALAPPARRLAGAPISWGVCEVPGWGTQLPPDRVLAEMAALGLRATELGPIGYLPVDPDGLRAALARHDLRLVGGFVPLVLHERDPGPSLRAAADVAGMLKAAGADVFVAAVVASEDWAPRFRLDDAQLERVADHLDHAAAVAATHGLEFAVHPHAGTLIETAEDVERLLGASRVGWCLDTGHLAIGESDPVAFARDAGDRIVHVHLKDVDDRVAARYRAGELDLVAATRAGLFRPLGEGDARIAEVLDHLDGHGYEGWLVLEQDVALDGEEPPAGRGPALDVRKSIEFLHRTAPQERGAST